MIPLLRHFQEENYGIDRETLAILEGSFEEEIILKGDYFLEQGYFCKRIAFVEKGCFAYTQAYDGDLNTLDFALEGEWIANIKSINDNSRSKISIQAMEDARVKFLKIHDFQLLWEKYPKIIGLRTTLVEKYFVKNNEHTRAITLLSAEAYYKKLVEESPELVRRVPLYHLASFLGVRPQSLSRIRKSIFNK